MTAAPQSIQPMTETLRQHIADYLAEREPDSYGDIDAAFTSVQRDELVEALRSHASLKARIEELKHPFRAVDELDWAHLFSFIPDSGHGKFWKAVFAELQTVLLNPTGAK